VNLPEEQRVDWEDPRGPDGVTILAPYEQPKPTRHPGLVSGDDPKPMMLFDLDADRGEQHDVAGEHPEIVRRLMAMFETARAEVVDFPEPKSDYLFERPSKGRPPVLMRLIGGDLRYDRVPKSQQHLVVKQPETPKSRGD
jgi:hypothetical protein